MEKFYNFERLCLKWQETSNLSLKDRYASYHMQQILILGIAMGKSILPKIINKMTESKDAAWHTALVVLTGTNPVPYWRKVSQEEKIQFWLDWWTINGNS